MKGIYQYKDLKTDEIIYIGKDSHIDKNNRHKQHLTPSRYDEQQINRVLQNNPDMYEYSVLYSSDDVSEDDLNMLEISFIKRYNPRFNYTTGGDGGYKLSEETKKKMSEAKKGKYCGENNHFYDKQHSEESKKKISKSRNITGYYRVSKTKKKDIKQGFLWVYSYSEDGKQKHISSVDIKKLEKKNKRKRINMGKNGGKIT